jgi:hypothetical protein
MNGRALCLKLISAVAVAAVAAAMSLAASAIAQGISATDLAIASRCVITGGTDNKNNCPEFIIKRYYIQQEPTRGVLYPGDAQPERQCSPSDLTVNAGENFFVGSVFPYTVAAIEGRPVLVVSFDNASVILRLLVILDNEGHAIASIRDNKFWVRGGYHAEYDSHSLAIYTSDDKPIFKVDLVNRCYMTLLGDFKYKGDELLVLPDTITTSPLPSSFGHNFFGNTSICVRSGRGLPCFIPPETALNEDWR